MKLRYIYEHIKDLALDRNKMAFISGPRQVGKTTLAKSLRSYSDQFVYENWDDIVFRRLWTKDPQQLLQKFDLTRANQKKLLALDEIHKAKGWKTRLKGFYDLNHEMLKILVTGSARLNVFKKGGDSLMGRYFNFRLHPFSYGELMGSHKKNLITPYEWIKLVFKKSNTLAEKPHFIDDLMKYGGFPEPLFSKDIRLLNLWQSGRHEKMIREDLRDLSRLPELSQVEMLAAILPEKIGNPLSIQSLREDLEVSFDTVKRWLAYLQELYFYFEIKPWSKGLLRSLKKEGKIYLFDWSEVTNSGAKFENLVASHLLKTVHFWVDTGSGPFDLHYVRTKEKEEIDFLVSHRNKPWLLVEVKTKPDMNLKIAEKFSVKLSCPYVQVVKESGHFWVKDTRAVISATRFFHDLP